MIIKKHIKTFYEQDIEFSEITLLSVEEYSSNENIIPAVNGWWWLRSPGDYQYYAALVYPDGSLYYNFVYIGRGSVRPALRIKNPEPSNLSTGDKLEFAGKTWTVLNDGLVLCDELVGQTCFREDREANDANSYEASDIKEYVEKWAKENSIEISMH